MSGNAAFGYFLYPPAWIGARPESGSDGKVQVRTTVVRRDLACGIAARATSDGVVLLDFTRWAPGDTETSDPIADRSTALRNRLVVLNAHAALLLSEVRRRQQIGVALMTVNVSDVITATDVDAEAWGVTNSPAVGHYLNIVSPDSYNPLRPATHDFRHHRTLAVDPTAVDASLATLDALLREDRFGVVEMLDLLHRAAHAAQDYAAHAALVQAWAVIEKLVMSRWEQEVGRLAQPPSTDGRLAGLKLRTRRSLDHREPSVSSVIEALTELRIIDPALTPGLDQARLARNKWMHELRPVDSGSALVAVRSAETLLDCMEGTKVTLAPDMLLLPM